MSDKLRRRIESDLDSLDSYNLYHKWIPSRYMIRPTPKLIQEKFERILIIESEWVSFFDFIVHHVFEENFTYNSDGKKFIMNYDQSKLKKWIFKPSDFQYQISDNSNHYILWSLDYNINYDFDDSIINNTIIENIKKIVGNDEFDFAWYKNPKPTIPEFYHVQVFWIKL